MPKNVSQRKEAKKWPMEANFQTPASTGHKVEMASANTVLIICFFSSPEGRMLKGSF